MALYGWTGRFFEVDPGRPQAEGICDRCGFRFNLENLQWQYDYRGTVRPINTRILVCGRPSCLDEAQPQNSPLILSPDPLPIYNARPEPYVLDETSWLSTEDGDTITAQDGEAFITPIPNPGDNANTGYPETVIATEDAISVLYMDLFAGEPAAGAASVLAAITGSATRTNIYSQMSAMGAAFVAPASNGLLLPAGSLANPEAIVVTTSALSTVNVGYVGFYDAASGGTLLLSAPIAVRDKGLGVWTGGAVSIAQLGLVITFPPIPSGAMVTEADSVPMISEGGVFMIVE